MSDLLQVTVGGQTLDGWTGYRVVRGLERLPSGLVLEFTERYPGSATQAPIKPGQPITATIGGDLVLTGYADLYWPHIDGEHHIVRAEMRSKTCDLVDCSITPNTVASWGGQWVIQGGTIGAVATQLAKPFGITVTGDGMGATLDPAMPFHINPGETPAQLLERMARVARVIMTDDEQGRLVLTNVHSTRAACGLVEGVNCKLEEARLSMDQRYSEIYVVSQTPSKASGQVTTWAWMTDPGVPRYRPLLVPMDAMSLDPKYPWQRAQWEIARRRGRSQIYDVTVQGHRDSAGNLWKPNTVVGCTLPSMKQSGDLLIGEVAYLGGAAGSTTLLTVMPAEAFQLEPLFIPNPFADDPQSGDSTESAQGQI